MHSWTRCLGLYTREVPTFRTCGITGFYVALLVLFAGGLITGRSLLVLAVLALVSGLSFFVYTYLRMWITGREELVLLEHVWFALATLACNAAVYLAAVTRLRPTSSNGWSISGPAWLELARRLNSTSCAN